MKTSRFSTLTIASALAVAFSVPALASPAAEANPASNPAVEQTQNRKEQREGKRPGPHRHDHRHEHRHERHHGAPGAQGMRQALQELQLTQEQKDRWGELRQASAPEMRNAMEEVRAARQELRELGRSGEFELAKAEELARRAAEPLTRISVLRAKLDADFRALLTPEQRSKLQEWEKQRAEEFKKRAEERKAQAQARQARALQQGEDGKKRDAQDERKAQPAV